MGQSLVKNLIHLVFSTKGRHPWIAKEMKERLYAYQSGILRNWESPAIIINGIEEHVHALISLSKNHALKTIVEELKKGSSKWMKTDEGANIKEFYWQNGYAGFSVCQSNWIDVRRYIEDQEEHHKKLSFQDELRQLFQRYEVEFDERYVWD
jgi:putative transposase